MIKLLSSFLLCCCFLPVQTSASGTLSGSVKGHQKQALADVMVRILNTAYGSTTNENGDFLIANIPDGRYKVEFKLMGHHTQVKSIDIKSGEAAQLHITLENSLQEINEVAVLGRNVLTEVSRQSYNVTAVNAAKLHNTTLDLSHALDRVSGIRVREEGGVGSRINFSLNGFTGKQVRFFIDGVPMDNFGSSFQINNLPINLAERIEVYKGVVPIWLGADALGGAVNIVTSNKARSYLDVSYSFGSFNTHKSTLNAGYTSKSGFTAQLNAFQNYSDNNYWVHVDVADVNTGKYYPDQRVRRFHDNYHNETIIGNIGFVNKKFADQLLLGMTLGKNHADVQTGARIVSVFGNYYTRGNIVMPSLKYAKNDLFVKGLNLRLNANYNLGEEQVVDTVYRRYNWFQ
ncbi:MAG TPA: TonB-dependent receptor, partial [Chitinophagaceae bacterium]|nr:TonB-dependent receptor [Chitinophagaceae bacterium]